VDEAGKRALSYLGVSLSAVTSGLPGDGWEEAVGLIATRLHELKVRPNHSANWQAKMRREGRCVVCGEGVWREKSCYCLRHIEARRKK
jgi:hypothetical protein